MSTLVLIVVLFCQGVLYIPGLSAAYSLAPSGDETDILECVSCMEDTGSWRVNDASVMDALYTGDVVRWQNGYGAYTRSFWMRNEYVLDHATEDDFLRVGSGEGATFYDGSRLVHYDRVVLEYALFMPGISR